MTSLTIFQDFLLLAPVRTWRPAASLATGWLLFMAASSTLAQAPVSNMAPPSAFFFESFKYIAPATGTTTGVADPKRTPAQQHIADLNAAGQYAEAGAEGLILLAQEKPDDGLKLIIANSLAWSGRLKDASATYQTITENELVPDANVGIANILHWKGQDHLAVPIYKDILVQSPDNNDARTGLELASREMVPRTTVTMGGISDSNDFRRGAATINHRWRDESGFNVMEVELNGEHDNQPGMDATQQDVTLRYQALGSEFKPAFELSLPSWSRRQIFAGLKLWFDDDNIQLDLGNMNWGRLANNANALDQGLSASHVGLSGKGTVILGELSGRVDYYNVSDTNIVLTSDARLTPNVRPFGPAIKPFLGVETRSARFNSPNYWSPIDGSGSFYMGLQGDWQLDDWMVYAIGQAGLGLYGDAGTSWSATGGLKRWVTHDVSMGFNLWAMSSTRNGASYSSQSAFFTLEKLWQ